MEQDYVAKVSGQLKLGGIKGWLHALQLAMNEPRGKLPSILTLDAFNSVGPDDSDVNLDFIRSTGIPRNHVPSVKLTDFF
jgi:hypothetical protein